MGCVVGRYRDRNSEDEADIINYSRSVSTSPLENVVNYIFRGAKEGEKEVGEKECVLEKTIPFRNKVNKCEGQWSGGRKNMDEEDEQQVMYEGRGNIWAYIVVWPIKTSDKKSSKYKGVLVEFTCQCKWILGFF